jgi:hypothetical protein
VIQTPNSTNGSISKRLPANISLLKQAIVDNSDKTSTDWIRYSIRSLNVTCFNQATVLSVELSAVIFIQKLIMKVNMLS